MTNKYMVKKLAIFWCVVLLLPMERFAARLVVTTDIDSVPGSLRFIVGAAQNGDTVSFGFSGTDTVVLKSRINLSKDIVIVGKNSKMRGEIIVRCDTGQCVFVVENGSAVFRSVTLRGTHGVLDSGGVLKIAGPLTIVQLDSVTICNGDALGGSGVYIDASTVNIQNSRITNNLNCGIWNNGGNLTITNTVVSRNRGRGCAGIRNQNGTIDISNCTISENSISGGGNYSEYGGGIGNYAGEMTITNCLITKNTSYYGGGGIYNASGTLTMSGDTVLNNYAYQGDGGGMLVDTGSVTIAGSILTGDSSEAGAGIYNRRGNVNLTGCSISDNRTSGYGGGIYNERGVMAIAGSRVSRDTAGGYGGGIYNEAGKLTVIDAVIDSTIARSSAVNVSNPGNDLKTYSVEACGGGIFNANGVVVISGSTLSNNRAQASATTGSSIVGLNSTALGGGIFSKAGSVMIVNSTLVRNTVSAYAYTLSWSTRKELAAGGGVYIGAMSNVTIVNGTLVKNFNGIAGEGKSAIGNSICLDSGGNYSAITGMRAINSMFSQGIPAAAKNCTTGVSFMQAFGTVSPVPANYGGLTPTVSTGSTSIVYGAGVRAGTFFVDTGMFKPVLRAAYLSGSDWLDLATDSVVPTGAMVTEITVDQRGIARAIPPCIGAFEYTPADHVAGSRRVSTSRYSQEIRMIRNRLLVRVSNRTVVCIELFDPAGRRVLSRTSKEDANAYAVDLSGLAAGTYLCSLSSPLAVTTQVVTVLR